MIGENGSGKTTIINAICYALFGVPYSDVNKPTIVNNINKKELRVELEFKVGTKEYKIIRGMKPGIFEVYEDGTLLPQEARSLDYQRQIEENILRLNFNAFKQIVVIGKGGFVPFMRLKAAERREIIENILDLRVFSTMNALLKGKNDELKGIISQNANDIEKADLELRYAKQQLQFIQENLTKNEAKNKKRNDEINLEIQEAELKIKTISDAIEKLSATLIDITKVHAKKSALQRHALQIESEMMLLTKQQNFFEKNETCPTCTQPIDFGFKTAYMKKNEAVISENQLVLETENTQLAKIDDIIEKIREKQSKLEKLNSAKSNLSYKVTQLQHEIVKEISLDIGNISETTDKVIEIGKRKQVLETEKDTHFKKRELYSMSSVFLKDTGIKSKIIATYIPLINRFLNNYLDLMNFYVQFEIDENFKEVIKSRYREEFSYENFSEGEKNRIDLALLFAWREIARTKNRINVNLLVLDEVFDGSLDATGLSDLNSILKSLGEEVNVFVISHKSEIIENFPRILEFEKKKNFSTMKVHTS